jgi:hypothetical protein
MRPGIRRRVRGVQAARSTICAPRKTVARGLVAGIHFGILGRRPSRGAVTTTQTSNGEVLMHWMKHRVAFHSLAGGVALVAAVLGTAVARADQVTSKGTVLRGKITGVSATGITFEPEYGKGSIAIKWEDIEDLTSEGNFQVLYGEDEESDTPLQGFSGGKLLTGSTPDGALPIEVATIHSGVPIGPDGPGWQDRLRSTFRYWDGNFDLAFNATQSTVDTTGLLIDFRTTRKKDPTRLILASSYRYATQQDNRPDPDTGESQEGTITQDQLYGLLRGEYDIIPRLYAFASGEATYDGIQKLSIRGIPKGGLGYLFWEQVLDEDRRNYFTGEVGGAWVYENFFSPDPDNDFFAIAFGAETGYHLPWGAHLFGRVDYLPAVEDFTGDYFLRSQAGLTMPLFGPIAAKFSVVDEYDSTPAADTQHNSLYIAIGLSLLW